MREIAGTSGTAPLLMVTGASGLLGSNLVVTALDSGWRVAAVSHVHPLRAAGVDAIRADLLQPGVARALVTEVHPDAVINTAAATNVDACEAHPDHAYRANDWLAREMGAAAAASSARLIHISTDAVFDGRDGGYAEDAATGPVNAYGRSKLAGEMGVLAERPEALIVRTTIYGWNAQPKQSLAEWFLAALRAGTSVPGFDDVWMTPILVNDLSRFLLTLARMPTRGILHLGGRDSVTKAEFGRRIAVAFGLDPGLVRSTSIADSALASSRATRATLAVARAEAVLGCKMPTTDEGIAHFRDLERAGLPQRLRGLLEEPS